MRGSPLIRSILMAVVLALAALGIRNLTKSRTEAVVESGATIAEASHRVDTPFFLTLSAPASEVLLEAGEEAVRLTPTAQQLSGRIPLTAGHPTLFLTVRWLDESTQPRFAKLRLEPEGLSTQERTFDAIGEISDVWEPHLH